MNPSACSFRRWAVLDSTYVRGSEGNRAMDGEPVTLKRRVACRRGTNHALHREVVEGETRVL